MSGLDRLQLSILRRSKMDEQLIQQLREFEADHVWINENLKSLLESHAEQWIAVKNGRVIVSDPDLDGLLSRLADPAHTCIGFISREPLEMVL
jgi:hypothetical protein